MLSSASVCGNLSLAVVVGCLLGWQSSLGAEAAVSSVDEEQVRNSLQNAIDAGDYQSQLPFQPIDKRNRSRKSPRNPVGDSALRLTMSLVAWIVVIVVVVLLVVALVVALSKQSLGQEAEEVAATQAEGSIASFVSTGGKQEICYLKRAEELAAQGSYQEAVHMLLLGAIAHLSKTSHLNCRSSETSREVLRGYQAEPEQRRALQSLVLAVERSIFGGRPLSREEFDSCHVCLKTLVQEANG